MSDETQPREGHADGVHPHEVHAEDLTLYVLGSAEGPELARISKHLEHCGSCRLDVQKLNADLGAFAMAAAPDAEPSAHVKERLLTHINRSEKREAMHRAWNWSFAFRVAVVSLLAVAAIIGWQNLESVRRDNARLQQELAQERTQSAQAKAIAEVIKAPDAMKLTLVAVNAKPQPMAHAIYSRDKASVFLMVNNLAPLGPGKMYELWLLPKWGKPVPAGMFQADASWHAQMLHEGLPSGMEAKGFAITIEPAEGSLAPSGQPVLMGTAS
jgi:anti-sigma-K factor RskA